MPRVGVPPVGRTSGRLRFHDVSLEQRYKRGVGGGLECLRSLYVVILISVQMLGMSETCLSCFWHHLHSHNAVKPDVEPFLTTFSLIDKPK